MPRHEPLDTRSCGDERLSQDGEGQMADDDEERDLVSYDRRALIGLVPDPFVVGYRDPAPFADDPQPFFIRRGSGEVLVVPLNGKTGG